MRDARVWVVTEKFYGHFPDRGAWDLPLSESTVEASGGFQVFRADDLKSKSTSLARTDELGLSISRYRAEGGENGLHSHPGDSIWFVVEGSATFWAADSVLIAELRANQGVMVPDGAQYRFMCTSDSVLLRFAPGPPAKRGE